MRKFETKWDRLAARFLFGGSLVATLGACAPIIEDPNPDIVIMETDDAWVRILDVEFAGDLRVLDDGTFTAVAPFRPRVFGFRVQGGGAPGRLTIDARGWWSPDYGPDDAGLSNLRVDTPASCYAAPTPDCELTMVELGTQWRGLRGVELIATVPSDWSGLVDAHLGSDPTFPDGTPPRFELLGLRSSGVTVAGLPSWDVLMVVPGCPVEGCGEGATYAVEGSPATARFEFDEEEPLSLDLRAGGACTATFFNLGVAEEMGTTIETDAYTMGSAAPSRVEFSSSCDGGLGDVEVYRGDPGG